MSSISLERKEAILKKLLPPHNCTVSETAKQEGISDTTLYNWLNKLKSEGKVVPGSKNKSDQWSAEMKFMSVVATANMDAESLSKYCRENGLYVEQIESWKAACIAGAMSGHERKKQDKVESRRDKQQIKKLEKELNRKEKALAETAALLVLRKKLNAFWGEGSEED